MKLDCRNLPSELNHPPPAVLLHGQDQGKLARFAVQLREKTLGPGGDDFDAEISHASDWNEERVITACRAFPFLSKRRFVHVRNAEGLNAAAVNALKSYLAKPSDSSLLLLTADALDAKSPLRKLFEQVESAWSVACYPMEAGELRGWLAESLKKSGYQVDPDALTLLGERLAGDSLAAEPELRKLLDFMGEQKRIGVEEVYAVVGETAEVSGFALAAALTDGRTAEALRVLDRLLEAGEEPIMLLGQITQRLRKLIQAQAKLAAGEPPQTVANALRLFWKEKDAFLDQARRTNPRLLAQALLRCQVADEGVKGAGDEEPGRVMERLALALCAIFRPRR
ncbi:MAG: DNA polymerase III subunit delta [Magnetococcales bacterium]|nr:DNA polymerase III subunit delta [Magnetococcales bacterium]